MPQPTLETERLTIRPFELSDAPAIVEFVSDFELSDMVLHIPHPYEAQMADVWLATHSPRFEKKEAVIFAITGKKENFLVGAIGLTINSLHDRAEAGYWIGKPHWNKGYASEALKEVIRYGFEEFSLNKIHAEHFTRNPASGRVMEKAGMKFEGLLKQHVKKGSRYEDVKFYSALREEFFAGDKS